MADILRMWRMTGRDTFHQFRQGMPDGELVAALLKSATGPQPKPLSLETASVQDAPLPPDDSPYFHVAGLVAKATVDFDLNRTLTPADLSRRLGERRREARNDNPQYSQDFGHKMFGSSKCVFAFHFPHSMRGLDPFTHFCFCRDQRFHFVDHFWRTPERHLHIPDGGTPSRWLGVARPRSDGSHAGHPQPHLIPC